MNEVQPTPDWNAKITEMREAGRLLAKQKRKQRAPCIPEILAPAVVDGGDTIPLAGVMIPLDWKCATRVEMAESARDLITKSYILGFLDPGFPTILKAVIEGKPLFEHNLGEFFQLYGQFMEKYQVHDGPKIRAKMEALVNGDQKSLKPLLGKTGKKYLNPLPYTVRQILVHPGNYQNTMDQDGNDLKAAIGLLRAWLSPK